MSSPQLRCRLRFRLLIILSIMFILIPLSALFAPQVMAKPLLATTVTANITTNTTWTLAGSPYIIENDIDVSKDATLTIEAGVEVRAKDARGLNIYGTLNAQGTAAQPIIFTSEANTSGGQWDGLWFSAASGNVGKGTLDYVDIRYGGDNYANLYLYTGANVTLTNSTIESSSGYGIYAPYESTLTVNQSTIKSNKNVGIYVNNNASTIDIQNTTFQSNENYPLRVFPNQINSVTNNTFTGNTPNHILLAGGSFDANATWSNTNTVDAYELENTVTVNPSAVLTIDKGVTVKGRTYKGIQVNGELKVQGTAAEPIVFTSVTDTTAGQWAGIRFDGYSGNVGKGTLDYVTVRYGGYSLGGYQANVSITNEANVTMSNSTIASSSESGVYVYKSIATLSTNIFSTNDGVGVYVYDSDTTIQCQNSTFQSNKSYPMRVYAEDIQNVLSNTFTGNTPNRLLIAGGSISTNTTWRKNDLTAYELEGTVTVNSAAVLTIEPGVTVMGRDSKGLQINGELLAQGTASNQIIFTSTSNNAGGQWSGLRFNGYAGNVGKGTLAYVTVRYGGDSMDGHQTNISAYYGADVSITNSTIASSSAVGLYINQDSKAVLTSSTIASNADFGVYVYDTGSSIQATGNAFNANGSYPIRLYAYDVNSLANNTYSSNKLDRVLIAGSEFSVNATWHAIPNVPYELENTVTVNREATLTIQPGVTIMGRDGKGLQVNGELYAVGTSAKPIFFTSTSNTSGGQWAGVRFNANSGNVGKGTLDYVRFYHGGDSLDGSSANLGITRGSHVSMSHGVVDSSTASGIYISYSSHVTITDSYIGGTGTGIYNVNDYGVYVYDDDSTLVFQNNKVRDCKGYPIRIFADDIAHMRHNSFANNDVNRVLVAGGSIGDTVTWNLLNGAESYELENDVTVTVNGMMNVLPGVVVKGRTNAGIFVQGVLSATGTLSQPILFTSATNTGGGQWDGIRFNGYSGNVGRGTLDYVTVRYGGTYLDGIQANVGLNRDADVLIRNSVITGSNSIGVYAYDSDLNMKCSTIAHNTSDGINLYQTTDDNFSGSSLAIFNNDGLGLNNRISTYEVDARYNWWGDASGPGGSGTGTGDEVNDNVLYNPWLDVHTCDLAKLIDLTVTKSATPIQAEMGKALTYNILVKNASPGDDMFTGVVMTDTLPAGLSFVSASATQGTCSEQKAVVSCNLGSLASGASTQVSIVVTPTVVGTIVNTVQVAAQEEELLTGNNTISVSTDITPSSTIPEPGASCASTIQSTGSGNWSDAATWSENRVPHKNDVVEIKAGHTIQARSPDMIYALCNYGTLQSTTSEPVSINAHTFIYNFGTIRGMDGVTRSGQTCGTHGLGVELRGSPIYNTKDAVIQAGNGGDGETCGGNGGRAMILGQNTTNLGTIQGGNGGNVTGTSQGRGGKGGDTHIWGKYRTRGGKLTNNGLGSAGNGGNGNPNAIEAQQGGNGGTLKLISLPYVYLNNGKHYAGRGGHGTGGGGNGRDGRVIIEPSVISLSGTDTQIRGGEVIIFGGQDWTLDMSNMSTSAISASESVKLAVGTNGTVDLRGNSQQIVNVGGSGVEVASDKVLVDNNSDIKNVLGSQVVTRGAELLTDASISGPEQLLATPGTTLNIPLTILNSGPVEDTYTLTWSDTAGWGTIVGLASEVVVDGLSSQDAQASIPVPASASNGDSNTITVTATSKNDPRIMVSTQVDAVVGSIVQGTIGPVYLPFVNR